MKAIANANLTVQCPVCRQDVPATRVEGKTSDTARIKTHDHPNPPTPILRSGNAMNLCVGGRCSVVVPKV